MADTDPPPDEFDPQFYHVIGNITSDWALLEYRINQCIWRLAQIEHDPLGACITAQITTFQSRIEAMRLLAMERGISKRHIQKINKFSEDARPLLEARNRAAHDPIGTENGKPV